jgi:hypothetical protein
VASEAGAERVSNPRLSGKYFAQPWWVPNGISALGDRKTLNPPEERQSHEKFDSNENYNSMDQNFS